MTERLTCSNCGAPITRSGNETSVTCPHCKTVTDVPGLESDRGDSGHRHAHGGGSDGGDGPSILIIQTGPTVVGRGGSVVVRRSSSFTWPIFVVLMVIGISAYVRMRVAHTEQAIEKAVDKAEKAAERPPPKGHH